MFRVSITTSGAYAVPIEGDYAECMEDIIKLAETGDPVIIVDEIEKLDSLFSLAVSSEDVQILGDK